MAVFHYIPLHSAQAGQRFSHFHGEDKFTTAHSERLLRLPIFYNMTDEEIHLVGQSVLEFYQLED